MADLLRVKDRETGHHMTITKARYDRDPSLWQELKSPATYADGTPVPPKYRTSVAASAAEKKAGQSAGSTEKE